MINDKKYSTCYLTNRYQVCGSGILVCPENLLTGKQIQKWVNDLKENPKIFVTSSLYLLRELYLQEVYVKYINITLDKTYESFNVDDIGPIEILDRDLEQSERYMNYHTHLNVLDNLVFSPRYDKVYEEGVEWLNTL